MPAEAATRAFLGLGGNIGDPAAAMAAALRALDAHDAVSVAAVSSLYRTPPWGVTDQPDFLNAVAAVDTALTARHLLDLCLDVERGLKRIRAQRWGPRVIDIDILLLDGVEWLSDRLQIPHPRMCERAFVLVPLMHLAPELRVRGLTPSQWLSRLTYSVEGDLIRQPSKPF